MPFMWADTLLAAEQLYLVRLVFWGAASVLVGTALLAWHLIGRRGSSLVQHFAIQTAAWGVAELALGAAAYALLALRDVASATRLDRLLWLNIGLSVGFMLAGVVLAVTGWWVGGARRNSLVGAGMGVIVQGTALCILDLLLAVQISR